MWLHLVNTGGHHWVINVPAGVYFESDAVDGSQPIILHIPTFGLTFQVTASQFNTVVGGLPTAVLVDNNGQGASG